MAGFLVDERKIMLSTDRTFAWWAVRGRYDQWRIIDNVCGYAIERIASGGIHCHKATGSNSKEIPVDAKDTSRIR